MIFVWLAVIIKGFIETNSGIGVNKEALMSFDMQNIWAHTV